MMGFNPTEYEYCQECPTPDEILWNYLGEHEHQKFKLKILSVLYFFLLLFLSFIILYFCINVTYNKKNQFHISAPFDTIITNIFVTILVPISLTFRALMNMLSEMRKPNTQTTRTMFIVLTTVLFHFLYYIIVPTFYM
jgi:hypothetical protein